jgi:hypothetical protein
MRYFTKQWYTDSLVAEMCFQLRKTEKAGEFSDKYFEKLYELERKMYIKHLKRAAKFERRKFDVDAAGAEFDSNFEENLAFVKANLPSEILDDVKDIRVLALGSATYDIAAKITQFCGQANRKCEAAKRKYEEATDEVVERLGGMMPKLLSELTGAPVALAGGDGLGNVVITTSHEYTGTALRVTLGNADLIELDPQATGSMLTNYELIAAEDGKFEFSLLTLASDSSLHSITAVGDSFDIEEI